MASEKDSPELEQAKKNAESIKTAIVQKRVKIFMRTLGSDTVVVNETESVLGSWLTQGWEILSVFYLGPLVVETGIDKVIAGDKVMFVLVKNGGS